MTSLSRRLLCISMMWMCVSTAFAFDMPNIHFFEPTKDDLSMWYLGNIFGSDLVPGANVPDTKLMGTLFGIFNQVVLVVTIIIVTYTIFAGALNSAAEGKPLGQKWNAVWLPIRVVLGIAALVPKAGTGYCLAQYVVMWLIMQGVGAADTLWGKMLDYFEAGGAIKSQTTVEKAVVFSYDNMNYTYALQSDQTIGGGEYGTEKKQAANLIKSMVCIEAHNHDPANADAPKWKVYLGMMPATLDVPAHPVILFGNPESYNAHMPINQNQNGAECGYVQYKINFNQSHAEVTDEAEKASVYMNGLLNMATQLDGLATMIVTTSEKDDAKNFQREYVDVQRAMQLYVNYIVSYRTLLGPTISSSSTFELYKQFGWILAGNYYTVLTNFREKANMQAAQFILPFYDFIYRGPISSDDPNGYYPRASLFYTSQYFTAEPEPMYAVPGSEYMNMKYGTEQGALGTVKSPITSGKAKELKSDIANKMGSSQLSSAVKNRVDEFMKYLTGEGHGSGLSAQDPISSAAKYGKSLTAAAVAMMITFGAAWTGLTAYAAYMTGTISAYWALAAIFADLMTPLILALGGFMYAQGAVLGVFVPLIPYVTFMTGVIGFMMSCIESVAAAPLVAMGLIFPETKDEVWGRAAPAFMLIINLFLRPSLMIIGFAAAMVLMWIMTEILNTGFIALMGATFAIEDMFGFVTILLVYVAAFTYIVTEVYSLINVVPNRVLAWVGDQSMGVKPAKEAIGAAKQGAEAGSATAVGGLEASSKADMWRVEEHARRMAVEEELADARRLANSRGEKWDRNSEEAARKQIENQRLGRNAGGGMSDGAKASAAAAKKP